MYPKGVWEEFYAEYIIPYVNKVIYAHYPDFGTKAYIYHGNLRKLRKG